LISRAQPAPHQFFLKTLAKKNEAEGEFWKTPSVSFFLSELVLGIFKSEKKIFCFGVPRIRNGGSVKVYFFFFVFYIFRRP